MKIVLVILLLAMICKDTAYTDYQYFIRGFAQALCLATGMAWMFMNADIKLFTRYWPIFGYLFISLVSGLLSPHMEYALIQTASLAAVLLFAIAYFESQNKRPVDSSNLYFNTTITAYTIVCIISIMLIKLNYSVAYTRTYGWTDPNMGIRFSGLYSISGMMAAASGLLIGYIVFRHGKWWWRLPALMSGLICLYLTQSRTFWIAAFISSISVWWIYKPHKRKLLIAVTLLICMSLGTIWILDISVDTTGAEKVARVGSITTLSGRLPMWEKAISSALKSPILGYGSTMGAYALTENSNILIDHNKLDGRELSHKTLHNGYLQSLLDLGVMGLLFYTSIFATALHRAYHRDKHRANGAVFYGVLFMAIANMGESIVYSAAVSHAVVFWILAVFALYRFSPENYRIF